MLPSSMDRLVVLTLLIHEQEAGAFVFLRKLSSCLAYEVNIATRVGFSEKTIHKSDYFTLNPICSIIVGTTIYFEVSEDNDFHLIVASLFWT